MAIRCSPTEPRPTHDFTLRDREGKEIGLTMSDSRGRHKMSWQRTPIERTALKTTSGNSAYSDLEYPYSPIVQDDWSGGRGLLDFERDATRFSDSFRMRTSRANKAFLGPQEQYTSGNRKKDELVPGNVKFVQVTDDKRYIARRFLSSATYSIALAWLLAAIRGAPGDFTLALHSDNAGVVGGSLASATVPSSRMADILSEWLCEALAQAINVGTYYWIVINAAASDNTSKHWRVATKGATGSTYVSPDGTAGSWTAASFDLYFRFTDALVDHSCLMINYKEAVYAFISGNTGAPKIFLQGYHGAAESNAGNLGQLKDTSATWTIDQWAGCVVMIMDGTGKAELTTYRTIVSNTATELVVNTPWTIQHDDTTEYTILGSNVWRELTGHGLTAPIKDILVSPTGVVYCCMGDAVRVRRLRAFNNAGTWLDFDNAANCQADEAVTTKAMFIAYKPQAQKIVIGNNSDAAGDVSVSVMSNATVPAWGTDLTWAAAVKVGGRTRRMTRLEVYPDASGQEAIYVGKEDRPWVVPASDAPYPIPLREMEAVASPDNFKASLVHNVYLYFPVGNGLERYYAGQLDDIGPNLGEGLPTNRRGTIIYFAGYPGRFFAALDGGPTGYSTIMARDGNGWHEHYRAPKGHKISCMMFQTIPGPTLDRMWLYVGNDLLWLPFPSGDTNELADPNFLYTCEGAIEMSRAHAGMFDVQKVAKIIKLWSQFLEEDVCWIELDYRLENDTAWSTFPLKFQVSPIAKLDLEQEYGLAAQQFQLRLRFYTTDASKTPVLSAVIIEAVLRISVKYLRPVTFVLKDRQLCLDRTRDNEPSALKKLAQLDAWAGENASGMLFMRSRSELHDGIFVFLNPIAVTQTKMKNPRKARTRNVFVCTTSVQDA